MPTIVEEYGLRQVEPYTPVALTKVETKGVVTSEELIGIEVEVENYQGGNGNLNRAWAQIEDGSLRNNGVEFITKPIKAIHAPACLQYLMHSYLNTDVCYSPRTSVHIHLNVQDLVLSQVQDIIMLYAVFEKLFYKYAGRGRQKNIYCVPMSDCDLMPHLTDRGHDRLRTWSKYTGLNVLTISNYGTIEFRHMHGTNDVEKLSTWINLICRFKAYVKENSSKHIRSLIAEMNDGFDFPRLMHEVFGDYAAVLRYEGPQEMGHLSAKQALASMQQLRVFMMGASKTSAFFKFKE